MKVKGLRKEMKEVVESNQYNWFTKKIQKMKMEAEQLVTAEEGDTASKSKVLDRKESKDKSEIRKSKQTSDSERISKLVSGSAQMSNFEGILEDTGADDDGWKIVENVTSSELLGEIEKIDLIKDLGIYYGNKIISKNEKKVAPEDVTKKPALNYFRQYKIICEAQTDNY